MDIGKIADVEIIKDEINVYYWYSPLKGGIKSLTTIPVDKDDEDINLITKVRSFWVGEY